MTSLHKSIRHIWLDICYVLKCVTCQRSPKMRNSLKPALPNLLLYQSPPPFAGQSSKNTRSHIILLFCFTLARFWTPNSCHCHATGGSTREGCDKWCLSQLPNSEIRCAKYWMGLVTIIWNAQHWNVSDHRFWRNICIYTMRHNGDEMNANTKFSYVSIILYTQNLKIVLYSISVGLCFDCNLPHGVRCRSFLSGGFILVFKKFPIL